MTTSRPLVARLDDYDGTHTDVLEALDSEYRSRPGGIPEQVWREAIELAGAEETRTAGGATWLLRRWIETTDGLPPAALEALTARLPQVKDRWARLHLVQALPDLDLPAGLAGAWADFCRAGIAAQAPFLRAWSVNGLVHLSTIEPDLEAEAQSALEAALADPKASVRARARKIVEGR